MKQCISCGREIEDTTNICPYCGMQQKKDPKTVAVIVIAGVIAILLLLLFLVLSLKSLFTKQIENTIAEGQSYMKNTTSASNVVVNEVTNTEPENVANSSIFQQPNNDYYSTIGNVTNSLSSQNAQKQNIKFEVYFGKHSTATEVKNLLSEIRTNNVTPSTEGKAKIVGVCFISPQVETNEANGVYFREVDSENLSSAVFDDMYFTADTQTITSLLKPSKTYTVNVPNEKSFDDGTYGFSGFEADENQVGQPVLGNSGGYYSNEYIRLIYIYEND